MIREWIREIFGLEKALKKQRAAVEHEGQIMAQQQVAKEEVRKQTDEVQQRLDRLRRQAEVIQRDNPHFRVE